MSEGPEVHLVMDNYATHKTPKIKAWLARRPHWHVQFTPTSASWINQVERWFAELTRSPAGWLASDNLVAGRPGL
jgi:transposase